MKRIEELRERSAKIEAVVGRTIRIRPEMAGDAKVLDRFEQLIAEAEKAAGIKPEKHKSASRAGKE